MENITAVYALVPRTGALELPITTRIPPWFSITFASINGGGFVLNTLSLWLLATRRFVYRSKVNTFIVSLCLSDFLVALSSFYYLATITSSSHNQFPKRVATIIFSFSLETSLMSLCCLSFERLTAIRKPFHYSEILSTKKVICIMIFSWMFCLSLLAMQFLFGFIYRNQRYVYFNWIVFISLALVTISFLAVVYVYLIYEIHRHSAHIKSCSVSSKDLYISEISSECSRDNGAIDQLTEVTFSSGSSEASSMLYTKRPSFQTSTSSPRPSVSKSRSGSLDLLKVALENKRFGNTRLSHEKRQLNIRGQLIRKERQSVFLCLSIVVVFAGTWIPVIIFFTRCLINHSCETDDYFLFICSCLVSLNSLLDPVLYFIIKREFRKFLCVKICRQEKRRRRQDSTTSRTCRRSPEFV